MMNNLRYNSLLAYREGKLSLSNLSSRLDMSMSEAIDLLATFGVQAPIHYDDYLQGITAARKAIH